VAGVGAFVIEADLVVLPGCDPSAVGAVVTAELCGHWEHDGPCRWPHNNAVDTRRDPARFRTLFVAEEHEAGHVGDLVKAALHQEALWRVVAVRSRPVAAAERALAERLLAGPRRASA